MDTHLHTHTHTHTHWYSRQIAAVVVGLCKQVSVLMSLWLNEGVCVCDWKQMKWCQSSNTSESQGHFLIVIHSWSSSHFLHCWYNKQTSGDTKQIWQHVLLELFPANPVSSFPYKLQPAWISCSPPELMICAHSIHVLSAVADVRHKVAPNVIGHLCHTYCNYVWMVWFFSQNTQTQPHSWLHWSAQSHSPLLTNIQTSWIQRSGNS